MVPKLEILLKAKELWLDEQTQYLCDCIGFASGLLQGYQHNPYSYACLNAQELWAEIGEHLERHETVQEFLGYSRFDRCQPEALAFRLSLIDKLIARYSEVQS